jgi:hypothetical protein
MPTSKTQPRHATPDPETIAEYEAAGAEILSSDARAKMRSSVTRLRRELRSAFAVDSTSSTEPGRPPVRR